MATTSRLPSGNYISSKEILEKTGISRVTLHNYIKLGLIPPPVIGPPTKDMEKTRKIGYFPSDVLETLALINSLKKKGYSLAMICREWGADTRKGEKMESKEEKQPEQEIETKITVKLPSLCSLGVLVANLQNPDKISTELLPGEYFELLSEIWSKVEACFGKFHGTQGKPVGAGVVRFFLAEPEAPYEHALNALRCAFEIRKKLAEINAEWKVRKKWTTTLCLNIGIHEGREWVGWIPVNQFTVLGDTVNIASRLSDFARDGAFWTSKQLISLLPPEIQKRIVFGIRSPSSQGEVFVAYTFSRVMDLIDLSKPENAKFTDISTLSVTELIEIDQLLF